MLEVLGEGRYGVIFKCSREAKMQDLFVIKMAKEKPKEEQPKPYFRLKTPEPDSEEEK